MERYKLSKLISSLREVKVNVPFFKFGPHTIPTRWHLYRNLLRYAPSKEVCPTCFEGSYLLCFIDPLVSTQLNKGLFVWLALLL